ncbi:MAG TPA: type II toxin-antitoxin system VapC family toxin [Candidatus Limnocylindrales bacterium]|nr:type II toxin-antitoxin system VapC family toxin [Candidatus Limnocylindrales bacterium]
MTGVLLDTSVVIDMLRGFGPALDYARGLASQPVCSEVTRVEVLRGVRSGERRMTERVLGTFRWIPVEEVVARRAGDLGRRWRTSHPGLGTADLIIAATALEHELDVATLNLRHFPMIDGIRPPYHG